ncbi:HNH endonuclease family protein [Cellulomonas timonensis]|uniref:HNH endonuclease family protein n=1 Tax=Cellulomonas timonensis TaxID=1689271 RepID=UPI000A72448D|nr:HNH endonuclease family protein [Cellulomonas timonensis]
MPSPRARASRSSSARPTRSTRGRWALLLVLAVAIGVGTPMWQDARAGADVPVTAADLADARTALDGLAVKGRAPKTGYERSAFGQAWADVDRNGCDTRNDILRRDLADLTFKADTDGCTVLTGTLTDPYGGAVIAFERGERSSEVQIDHVVALSDAWQKGAQQWTTEVRTAFANDPANLLAVDGPLNQQKGAGDAATWLPPLKGYRCVYVVRQIRVKSAYGLWVTQAEHDAMGRELDRCVTAPAAS